MRRLFIFSGVVVLLAVGVVGLWLHVPIEPPKPSRAKKVLDVCPPVVERSLAILPTGLEAWQLDSGMWRDMGEPLLACGPSNADETYRVTWWHSFTTYDPLVVRVERSGTRVSVSGSVFRWVLRGTDVARLNRIYHVERNATGAEWKQFVDMIGKSDFWNWESAEDHSVMDGSVWVLEGRAGHGYQFVEVHVPAEGDFKKLALSLIRLSRLQPPQAR